MEVKGKNHLKLEINVIFFLYTIILLAFLCGIFNELIITNFRKKQIG